MGRVGASGGSARSFVRIDLKAILTAIHDAAAIQARYIIGPVDGSAIYTSRIRGKQWISATAAYNIIERK
jgi:hypothetical protein